MLGFQVITPQIHVHETEALSKFWTLPRQSLVRTSGPVFTKIQSEFARAIQRRVTKRVASFLESPGAPSEHAEAKKYKDQKLDVCSKVMLKLNF